MSSVVDYRWVPADQGGGLQGRARCSTWWIRGEAAGVQCGVLQERLRFSGGGLQGSSTCSAWWIVGRSQVFSMVIRGEVPGAHGGGLQSRARCCVVDNMEAPFSACRIRGEDPSIQCVGLQGSPGAQCG